MGNKWYTEFRQVKPQEAGTITRKYSLVIEGGEGGDSGYVLELPDYAREALAQDNLYPRIAAQSPRSAERKSVIHVSGRFCWVKVNGQWLYKTRQIVTGRNKHPARWMLWRPNRRARIPFSPALRKTHPLANPLKPEDVVRPAIGVKLSLATRPSILAGEGSVT